MQEKSASIRQIWIFGGGVPRRLCSQNRRLTKGAIASGKLEKGERDSNSETFHATLRVIEFRPAELGQRPEASLAWGKETSTAKRRQRVPMPCDRASKYLIAGASLVDTGGGHVETPQWPGVSVLPGSKNRA